MKSLRIVLALSVIATGVLAGAAGAHRADLVAATGKAGPIRRSVTTLSDMRDWFGPPSSRDRIRVGCVRVVRALWGRRLAVYTSTNTPRTVQAIFVRKPSVTSDEHGDLNFHTRRGLQVGDRERKLERLYPGARPITHSGHTHYRLATARHGGYLMGKVVDGRVVQLEVWPFEFC
jgi:hypothetical protein